MALQIPGDKWVDLKKELMQRWNELSESELDRTRGRTQLIIDLIEKKVGLAIEEAGEKFAEIASHYHVYDEPQERPAQAVEEKKEKILELKPKKPANRDRKPKEDFHL